MLEVSAAWYSPGTLSLSGGLPTMSQRSVLNKLRCADCAAYLLFHT